MILARQLSQGLGSLDSAKHLIDSLKEGVTGLVLKNLLFEDTLAPITGYD